MDNIPPFSSDDDIDSIRAGDKCVEIVGYIDELEGQKMVGSKIKHRLLKFVINNGSNRRVQCLLWNDQIALYELQLKLNEIIHIDGGTARSAATNYIKGEQIIAIEVNVQVNTQINFYGSHQPTEMNEAVDVTFQTIQGSSGLVRILGFVKTVFRHLANGRTASGSICDGVHKINIMIQNYIFDERIVKGIPIRVIGNIVVDVDKVIQIQCSSNSNIEVIENEEPLNLINILQSNQSVRKIEFDV